MSDNLPPQNSLVLYKNRPARVLTCSDRLEIEPEGEPPIKVRPKDVALLHPGPLQSLNQLGPLEGDIELAWEMLTDCGAPNGEAIPLRELADLIYGEDTPRSAWAAWQQVEDGLYFHGKPEAILPRTADQVEKERRNRQAKADEARLWQAFLERARLGKVDPQQDNRWLRELEDLAFGRRHDSRLLRELGRSESPEAAHALLLQWGHWDETVNPYPGRLGVSISLNDLATPGLPEEDRLDLTGLNAYAIDDRGNQDPDDAVSLISVQTGAQGELLGGRIWVHVADPAAIAPSDSPLDIEARLSGATFYRPEGAIPMLPQAAVEQLALGLAEVSPALSFELELDQNAAPHLLRSVPSRVRVQRLSYEDAESQLVTAPFNDLLRLTQAYEHRRLNNGALSIDLPEAIFHVVDGQVEIRPVVRLASRDLVREVMLMTGEALGRFALDQGIPFPFTSQEPPDFSGTLPEALRRPEGLETMAGRYAIRRYLKRSQIGAQPGRHAGLGLPLYSRSTSPLRRYMDLVAHQQVRAFLAGKAPLDEQALLERVAAAEEVSARISQAESLSRRHWTLVYLKHNPEWRGEGWLVDKKGLSGKVILPDLAYETMLHLRADLPLNSRLQLRLRDINLAELEANFALA